MDPCQRGPDWMQITPRSAVPFPMKKHTPSGLRKRGLPGIRSIVPGDHASLRLAVREVLTEAAFPRYYATPSTTPWTICPERPRMPVGTALALRPPLKALIAARAQFFRKSRGGAWELRIISICV